MISDPLATARLAWLSPEEGGRRSGPPPGPTYAATAVFVLGEDEEIQPHWPASGDHLSILVEYLGPLKGAEVKAKIDFIDRERARRYLHPGSELILLEGARPVARAWVISVTQAGQGEPVPEDQV